jgi:hypothetical protein
LLRDREVKMRNRWTIAAVLVLVALVPRVALADDISGADRILCSSVEATVCTFDAGCEIGAPWSWGIPQFIEIDLQTKRLSTTSASGESRSTPATSLKLEDGLIFIQGVENGRAFSFVINQETGVLSAAVAREGITVSVFGACTPLAGK